MLLPLLIATHVPSFLPLPLSAPSALQGTPSAPDTTAEAVEDVEVLRRLLVEAIEPAREYAHTDANGDLYMRNLTVTDSILTFYAGRERVASSRGYLVPGSGAFYSLDVRLPVVAADASEAPVDGKEPREDEWERTRRAVREGSEPRTPHLARELGWNAEGDAKYAQRLAIDEDARDEVVDAVLATLAKHGSRLRGLASGDDVAVALYVEGSGNDGSWVSGADGKMLGTVKESTTLWRSMIAQRAPPEHVVVRIPFDALRSGSLAEVRRAAQVQRY
jgi:hypothetical protein